MKPTVSNRSVNRSKWNAVRFLAAITIVVGSILAVGQRLRLERDFPVRTDSTGVLLRSGKERVFADPDKGELGIRSADGSVIQFGSGPQSLPDWMPVYPGFAPRNVFRMQAGTGGGSVGFVVDDSVKSLCERLPAEWRKSGLVVEERAPSKNEGCMLLAEQPKQNLTVLVSIGASANATAVNVTYTKR